ncbi:uncharacterized protein LOC122372337 [Amphibalanus amphitrite]|uniref:uncharacterized protein LOC122372337 n=1 Tax=Amphibalanus amphitrite TaxID=1232801 RepID=UPI001C8FEB62|nr:uncharacterized protein LOC122372337 [Amphibalanus amphitrite]
MVVPVRISHAEHPEKEEVVYALLDPQSDACFVKESVATRICAKGEDVLLELRTMAGETTMKTTSMKNLIIRPLDSDTEIKMPATYSRKDIPAERHLIPRAETIDKWPHLKTVSEKLPPYFPGAEVGLLVGMNCPRAIKPRDIVQGDDEDPWAVKTDLGWSVVGPVQGGYKEDSACRYVSVTVERRELCHFTFRVHAQEVNLMQIARMMDTDFQEPDVDKKMSYEDQKFLNLMDEKMHQREDGHFEAPLPLKDPALRFPNNRQAAERRLTGLKKRLNRDPSFRHEYEMYMDDMLKRGFSEPVPENELLLDNGKVWYVAHHGVYHPKKKKLRVVFDCSDEYRGLSLNSQLLQGPDHANNLTGVLIRFRKHPVVLGCDIEGMYNQVGVDAEHRNLLRFLWWKNGDQTSEPAEYRMTTHLFGATSSPSCAMYALNATADKFEDTHGEEAANFIRRNFYVDDGLISTPDADTAIRLARSTSSMCREGGFRLHKFASNDPEVMKNIPPEDRSKNLQNVELGKEKQPLLEQALGLLWNARKNILKQLCCSGSSWDDVISEDLEELWEAWKSDTEKLPEITVPRCYPRDFGKVKLYELHHFSDASVDGCAQCSYLRMIDDEGVISSQLVMSKTKVTPKRPVTVPRLELIAAVMSARASRFLRDELDINDLKEYFWTDSKVVLGYLLNESKRFHVFVANRIQQVRLASSPEQWRYIKSEENPADLASRGLSVDELKDNDLWWTGPSFFRESADLPAEEVTHEVDEDDPEVKKSKRVLVTHADADPVSYDGLPKRLERFSSWFRAKKSLAICLRYVRVLRRRMMERLRLQQGQVSEEVDASLTDAPITAAEMKEAERIIIKSVQNDAFKKELKTAAEKKVTGKQSDLHRLDPGPVVRLYCDNGTNFVGGRRELETALDELSMDKLRRELLKDECDLVEFRMNPPRSSHMGGIWERQIRWRREVLPTLQERRKWTRAVPNIEEGDIVLVADDSVPRNSWPLGRVIKTYPSADRLVRSVQIRLGKDGAVYDRPIHCLVPMVKADSRK